MKNIYSIEQKLLKKNIICFLIILFNSQLLFSQISIAPPNPKVVGYLSFIIPTVTYKAGNFEPNFKASTSIGFPIGINVLYSEHFGFSYEITPTIVSTQLSNQGLNSKITNILFDPGPMFRFKNGFTLITRLAFETSGRFGFTPVFNQIYARTKYVNYFIAGSLPTRFGNSDRPSIGLNVQFGFIFN